MFCVLAGVSEGRHDDGDAVPLSHCDDVVEVSANVLIGILAQNCQLIVGEVPGRSRSREIVGRGRDLVQELPVESQQSRKLP